MVSLPNPFAGWGGVDEGLILEKSSNPVVGVFGVLLSTLVFLGLLVFVYYLVSLSRLPESTKLQIYIWTFIALFIVFLILVFRVTK
ncbi:Hypothetical protein POVN_LOCUS446 [uncultured virus]|nr:Hypothetical protein POVN_LOCUS446 [uncultured virus]